MVPQRCDIYSEPLKPHGAPPAQIATPGWFGRPVSPPNGPALP